MKIKYIFSGREITCLSMPQNREKYAGMRCFLHHQYSYSSKGVLTAFLRVVGGDDKEYFPTCMLLFQIHVTMLLFCSSFSFCYMLFQWYSLMKLKKFLFCPHSHIALHSCSPLWRLFSIYYICCFITTIKLSLHDSARHQWNYFALKELTYI